MIYEVTGRPEDLGIIRQMEETMIWSCLQGVMGKIYTDDLNNPTSAMVIPRRFYLFRREAQYGTRILQARLVYAGLYDYGSTE